MRKRLSDTVFFATYMLVYMYSLGLIIEQQLTGMEGDDVRLGLYILQQVFILAGFLLPSFIAGIWHFITDRKTKTVMFFCYAASVFSIIFVKDLTLHVIFLAVCALCLGMTGTEVYRRLAVGADFDDAGGRRDIGFTVGVGGMTALLVQWMLQSIPMADGLTAIILTVLYGYLIYVPGSQNTVNTPEDAESGSSDGIWRRRGIFLSISVVCMLMLLAYYESHMNRVSFAVRFYEWFRIFAGMGYLLIGLLYGRMKSAYVSIVMICTALASVVSSFLMLRDGEGTWIHLALFYLVLGSLVTYYNLMFMELSVRTSRPVRWAAMGRVLDAAVTALFTAIGAYLPTGEIYVLLMYLLLFAGALISMFLGGLLSVEDIPVSAAYVQSDTQSGKEGENVLTVAERIELFAEKYGLTSREKDVLSMLVTTESKNQEIADTLYISRRQLQNHISSI